MRIVILYYHNLFDPHAGGILNYTKGLIKHGCKSVEFVYWGKGGGNDQNVEFSNLKVKKLCSSKRFAFIPEIFRISYHIFRHRKEIELDGEVLFIQLPELAIPWLMKKKRIPIVLRIPGCRKNDYLILSRKEVIFNHIADWIGTRIADKVIVVSKEGYDYYTKKFPRYKNKFLYIPTFADDSIIPSVEKEEALRALQLHHKKIICYVGRLAEPKRLDQLIEVFFHIQKRNSEVFLCIAGEGPLKNMISNMAKDYGILDKIQFMGVLDREKVGLLFRASDICFLFTKFEGNSLSLMESLACGTPLIVSDVADHRNIIKNGKNGYVITNESPEEIASFGQEIISSYPTFHEEAFRLGRQYRASQVVPQILDVFRSARREFKEKCAL